MPAESLQFVLKISSLPKVFLKSFSKFKGRCKKHSSEGVLSKRCSQQCYKIPRKISQLEPLFNEVDVLKACNTIRNKF